MLHNGESAKNCEIVVQSGSDVVFSLVNNSRGRPKNILSNVAAIEVIELYTRNKFKVVQI